MAFVPFTKDDQPTMAAFNGKFQQAIDEAVSRGVKIEVGSYVGTGTYGSSNPNSLTFGFKPAIVFIFPVSIASALATNTWNTGSSSTPSVLGGATLVRGVEKYATFSVHNEGSLVMIINWDAKSVSFYEGTKAAYGRGQLNASGVEYKYIAIG